MLILLKFNCRRTLEDLELQSTVTMTGQVSIASISLLKTYNTFLLFVLWPNRRRRRRRREEATVTGGTPRTVKSKKKNSNVLFLFHWIGDEKGIYIQKIADGSAAAQDGRLQPDDQIIEVL